MSNVTVAIQQQLDDYPLIRKGNATFFSVMQSKALLQCSAKLFSFSFSTHAFYRNDLENGKPEKSHFKAKLKYRDRIRTKFSVRS